MASLFAYNVLTLSGMQLVAKATAANKLIIVGTKSSPIAALSSNDLAEKPLSWYTGKAGTIQSVSSTEELARIVARYANEGTQQVCKSVCITGVIEGDSEPSVLVAMSDPDSQIILPGESDIEQMIDIPFNLAIKTGGSVEVTPGASASLADLERFVSAHSALNPQLGDSQNILGEKHFLDTIKTDSILLPSPSLSDGNYTLSKGCIVLLSLTWTTTLLNEVTINAGDEVKVGTSGCNDIKICRFNTNSSSVTSLDGAGISVDRYIFSALCGSRADAGSNVAIVLAACIGENT